MEPIIAVAAMEAALWLAAYDMATRLHIAQQTARGLLVTTEVEA